MTDFPLSFEDWEKRAREKLSQERFAHVAAGAGTGESVIENVEALKRWRLVPRVLGDTSSRSTSTKVLGQDVTVPIMLAPVRGLAYIRERGEEVCAGAAAKCSVPLMLSNLASATPEAVARIMAKTPHFFQLYPCNDSEVVDSLLRRAETSGYQGIVMTVDMAGNATKYSGPRTTEYEDFGNEVYFSDPVFLSRLKESPSRDRRAALEMIRKLRRAQFTWDDVSRIRDRTKLPLVLKGVLRPDDAKEAIEKGVNGVVVSNHGGRNLDGIISPIDVLTEIRDSVGDRLAVLFDGGIRSGSDVVKALALGADAVLIGRAYVYALAVAGEEGVVSLLKTMIRELDSTLATCGCSSIGELNRSFVRRV
ncbi:MAG: alpha-hydroxy-acid oxidizing protein [Nitrososphaerales archaeon]|jgi:isopentenyl diphosphate isomerase/L-lactate dehydrogenase-like FMN-dependent dehydrogenase